MEFMKKYVVVLFALLSFSLIGCNDDDDNTQDVLETTGDWWVTVNIFDNGQEYVDPYGVGRIPLSTYATEANVATEMWVDDLEEFWDYKVIVNVDDKAGTFSTDGFALNYSYDSTVKITEGKVLKGAATTPAGVVADSIVFFVEFSDDNDGYLYKVSGFRKSATELVAMELVGDQVIALPVGTPYVEPGVVAKEGAKDVSASVKITGEVNTNEAGTYILKYVAMNGDGEETSLLRTVSVYS